MAKKPYICGGTELAMPECGKDEQQDARLDALEECCTEARGKLANHETRITNNEAGIANIVENLKNYYTKAETYNKEEVNNLISRFLTIRKVNELPATGEQDVIYLVPKQGEAPDVHNEYIWQDGAWELIGDTQIDLSDYYTKGETDILLDTKQNKLIAGSNIQINGNTISATDTTYSAGTGLSMSGTTINHSNSVTAQTTEGLRKVKYDAQGHITGSSAVTKADITALGIPSENTDTKYEATKESIGSASGWNRGTLPTLGTAIPADDITSWSAGSLPTLGTAIAADDITNWSAGSLPTLGTAIAADDITAWDAGSTPTLGTAIPADDITNWSAGTAATSSVSAGVLTLNDGTAPSLSYTAKSIPNVTSVGTKPSLSYTARSIPNVTGVGSLPSLSYTARSIPNVTDVGSLPSLSYTAKSIPNVTGVGTLPSLTVTSKSVVTDIAEQ